MSSGMTILCKGVSVSHGIVHGKVKKLKNVEERVTKDDILILESSDPSYAIAVMQAGGVIMERGGRLAHLCIVALEMGIPCITQVEGARKLLDDGQYIVLDAKEGNVYERL